MKRKVSLMLAVVTIVTTSLLSNNVKASQKEAAVVEQESVVDGLGATEAEIKANAVELTSGMARVDSIAEYKDVNWYKFTVPKTGGYINYSLSKIDADSDGMWSIEWYFENVTDSQFWNPNYSTYDSGKLTLAAGTWYIKVSGETGQDYKFSVTFTTDSAYESEENNTMSTANDIDSGKTYYGQIDDNKDKCDWYKLTMTQKGYFIVDINQVDIEKNTGWSAYVSVYNDSYDLIYESNRVKTMKSCKIACGPGIYYIKVEFGGWVSQKDTYALRATTYYGGTVECEKNDTYNTANVIKTGIAYDGALQHAGDQDWYRFKLTSTGVIFLEFNRRNYALPEELGNGWKISIYKGASATPIKTLETKDTATYKLSLKKGTYSVRIYSDDFWAKNVPVGHEYSLKVNYTKAPKTVKLKPVTAGKRRATIKWNKSNDATGYYIYRSTKKNSGYKKIATIKKNKTVKYVDKKSLKSNRTYYYKVVAYKKTKGLTATSSMSSCKGIKIK